MIRKFDEYFLSYELVLLTADILFVTKFLQNFYLILCLNTPKLLRSAFEEEIQRRIAEFGRWFLSGYIAVNLSQTSLT